MAEGGGKSTNFGLFVLRFVPGILSVIYGIPMLFSGAGEWGELGKRMALFGVTYAPEFWGFVAGFALVVGGACLALGLVVRWAAGLMFLTMLVASVAAFAQGDWLTPARFAVWSGPIAAASGFLGICCIGGGAWTVSSALKGA